MFENEIKFISHEDYVNLKECYPIPIKLNIPDWYKKLTHGRLNGKELTVKGCMPFLDTLTTGYLLKASQDIKIEHNVWVEGENKNYYDSFYQVNDIFEGMMAAKGLNFNMSKPSPHPPKQLGDSPLNKKNRLQPFHKIHNPWIIKTPPGYSCLFLPPMNNHDDRFSIIPGIVDTDTFPTEINFPIVINGDKYKTLRTIIKQGTPYVQIIPFKRESWKMKIVGQDSKKFNMKKLFYPLKMLNNYKDKFWHKKTWK